MKRNEKGVRSPGSSSPNESFTLVLTTRKGSNRGEATGFTGFDRSVSGIPAASRRDSGDFDGTSLAEKFPYLVKKKLKEGEEVRRVAQLDWRIIESDCAKPFISSGLEFVPLPVMHGEDYVCLGFLFGKKSRTAYISDVSRFPATTEHLISKAGGGQLDLLILDTLYKKGSHNTHFCLQQSLDAVNRIRPKQALFIGMTHEFDHHKDNKALAEWSNREGIPVQLAHDGMRIFRDL